jgi:hypothetical protein
MSGYKGSETDNSLGCVLFVIALALFWYLFFDNGIQHIANRIGG